MVHAYLLNEELEIKLSQVVGSQLAAPRDRGLLANAAASCRDCSY